MPLFKNTSDEDAKRLLGSRFDLYVKEDGDFDQDVGIFTSASRKFGKSDRITQFVRDVGHAYHSAFSPNIATMHLLIKDGEEKCHNNRYKNNRMSISLGGEYLDLLGCYGIATFNPSRKLTYTQNMDGLRMVLSKPIESFERFHSNTLDLIYGHEESPHEDDFKALSSGFRNNVTYAYLKSMLMSNEPVTRSGTFDRPSVAAFVEPLGIVAGSFSAKTLRDSEDALRALCTNSTSFTDTAHSRSPLALAFASLPGQALILKGEDPHAVFEVIKSRAAIALTTQDSCEAVVEIEATAIARQVFLPFPELWSELNINSVDYLGLPAKQRDDHKLICAKTHAFGTMSQTCTPMVAKEVLATIHFNLECFGFTFGSGFYLRPAATPEAFANHPLTFEQFSEVVEEFIGSKEIHHSRFIEDPQNLAKTDPDRLASVVVKALSNPEFADNLVKLASRHNPKAVDLVFENLLESEADDEAFESLLKHYTPAANIIKKLPRHLRGKVLGTALGL